MFISKAVRLLDNSWRIVAVVVVLVVWAIVAGTAVLVTSAFSSDGL